jgi:hypothetical protein
MTNSTSPSFECMINVLNSSTHGNSVTSTATDSVIGTPMIGHDVFHSIANNLVNKIIKHNPEVIPILIQYDVNLDNPSSFDCKGERLAILTQEFVKSFWIKSNGDHNYLMCDSNKIPTFNNLTRLASVLAFDINTNLDLCRHQFGKSFYSLLNIYSPEFMIKNHDLYKLYIEGTYNNFSLQSDIELYLRAGQQSFLLSILEQEYHRASGMNWDTYLNGSRILISLIENIYLSEFDSNDFIFEGSNIAIKLNNQTSQLQLDMIKYNCCCQTLNSYKVEDFVARSGKYEDTVSLIKQYNQVLSDVTDKIRTLTLYYSDNITSIDEYNLYTSSLTKLEQELKTIKNLPSTLAITDQLIKYYGYCDL